MGKIHKNRRYYIDASALPVSEYNALFDLFDGWGFMVSMDYEHPRCFIAYWDMEEEPGEIIKIPPECKVSPLF